MKKYLLFIILLMGAFLFGRFYEKIKRQIKKLKFKLNLRLTFIVAVFFLFLGIFIGKGTKGLKNIAKNINEVKLKVVMPAKLEKILLLNDFESEIDFKKWKTRKSTFEQSNEYATEGKYSGKMIFFGGVECSNILMEDFFEDNPHFGNWSSFNQLKFDIYNTGGDTERLILKIKDRYGRSWQRNMFLPPEQSTEMRIYIDELKDAINISGIQQFNFFRWEPKNEVTFYIDNIRLIRLGAEEQKEIEEKKKITENNKFLFEEKDSDFGIGVETAVDKVFLEPDKFKGEATDILEISLAKNECESSQLVIYAKKPQEVKIEIQDLTANINGNEIKFNKNNINCYIVGYVKTRRPSYDVSYVGWWPDPLEEKLFFSIKENAVQPIWIEVFAPPDTPPGEYSGDITLKFANSKSKNIKLKVKVWDFSLPKETHLKTAFDLYDGRLKRMYPKREREDQEEYEGRIHKLKVQYFLDMIKHRISPIFNFDLSNSFVLEDIRFYVNHGLSNFAVGRFGGSFGNNWPKDLANLEALIPVYRNYAKLLKDSGLIDKAYIYSYDDIDYGNPHADIVTKMIHKADSNLRNMVGFQKLAKPSNYPGWGEDIDILSLRSSIFNEKIAKFFKDKGKEIWTFVSGPQPPYPTLVIDYPAIAYRIIPWMCWKYEIKGYLYWCVNFWNENPWENPMNTQWEQNGNGFLYYPGQAGPVPSIRLEVTRDGIEDYEYLFLLAQKIEAVKDKNLEANNRDLINRAKNLLNIDESIVSSMADYTKDAHLILKRRDEIAKTIEELNRILGEDI